MSDTNKNPRFKLEIPECLEEPVKNLATPVSKEIGQTLGDVWFLIFGKLGLYSGKKRAEYEQALTEYKASLEHKIENIPPEKLALPDTQVVAGALEDSRFCVEKKELREMFENLIAASVNSDTADFVHPSFSNIIRRMSPHDAEILSLLKVQDRRPIVHYIAYLQSGGSVPYFQNVIRVDDHLKSWGQDSLSLECLRSLGLISIDFNTHLVNDEYYKPFAEAPIFTALKIHFASHPDEIPSITGWDYKKGIVALTDLGMQFLKVCT